MSRRRAGHKLLCTLTLLLFLLGVGPAGAQQEVSVEKAAGSAPEPAAEGASELSLADALRAGKAKLSLRYRFEYVEDDAFSETAEASTLRTAFSYRSAEWKGWSLFLEAEDVSALFDDDGFNNAGAGDLNNGVRGVPVVADPDATDLNQAYLRWRHGKTSVTLGRQEINLGDQRFVGAVGWRQNHQSFDAARITAELSPRVKVDYSYVEAVQRIFGDDLGMQSHFLDVPIAVAKDHRLSAYGFWLDYDAVTPASTSTFGLEYSSRFDLGDKTSLRLELEAASQQDISDNPVDIDTDYRLASLGLKHGRLGFDVTWELIGARGNGFRAFQTPLATLHKWNGWADKFLQTPSAGLETLYLRFKGSWGQGWRFAVIYHTFDSDSGDIDYGKELDAELVYKAPWNQTFALKLASYDADRFSTDTEKIMLWTSYAF